jgi:hypothetical protein
MTSGRPGSRTNSAARDRVFLTAGRFGREEGALQGILSKIGIAGNPDGDRIQPATPMRRVIPNECGARPKR